MANMYGSCVYCSEEDVPKLKPLLLKEMIEMIRQLAEMDDFWLIEKHPHKPPQGRVGVAYRICIPQMRKGHRPWESCCDHCPNCGTDARGDGNV